MPKVSVIIPVYKVEKYLEQCLDSVVNQTLRDIELIIVDEGDQDRCREIIDEYEKKDPRVVALHEKNGGYGASVNRGLSAATGEYIGIVESDDFINPDMFERLYDYAVKMDADIAKSSFVSYYDELRGKKNAYYPYTHQEKMSRGMPENRLFSIAEYPILLAVHPSLWSAIYRAQYLRDHHIRFDEAKGAGYVDQGFKIDVLINTDKIAWMDQCFYNYRCSNENASSFGMNWNLQASLSRWTDVHQRFEGREEFFGKVGSYMLPEEWWCTFQWFSKIPFTHGQYQALIRNMSYYTPEQIRQCVILKDEQKAEMLRFLKDPDAYYFDLKKPEIRTLQTQLQKTGKELECVRRSLSYRIGRAVTWFPRKARSGVRCLRQHGWRYTWGLLARRMGFPARAPAQPGKRPYRYRQIVVYGYDEPHKTGGPAAAVKLQRQALGERFDGIPIRCQFRPQKKLFHKLFKEYYAGAFFYVLFKELFCRKAFYISNDTASANALALLKKPYALVVHTQGPIVQELMNRPYVNPIELKRAPKAERRAFLNARTLRFPSSGAAQMYFDSEYRTAGRHEVKLGPPMYNYMLFSPPPKRIERDAQKLTFFSCGTMTPAKGQDQSMRFIEELLKITDRPIRYIVLGRGILRDQVNAFCRDLEKKYAHFEYIYLERVDPQSEVYWLHTISDVYLMLHRISVFDLATLEAMSASSAVVLSDAGGNPEFNVEENIILVRPGKYGDAARDLLSRDLESLKALNHEIHARYFSKEAYRKNYAQLLEKELRTS